jgi:predicted RNase H-like HicB family nuclease
MILSAIITEAEEGGFIAYNPETGTTTQGETRDEALANLREATALYLEEFPHPVKGAAMMTSFELSDAQTAGC